MRPLPSSAAIFAAATRLLGGCPFVPPPRDHHRRPRRRGSASPPAAPSGPTRAHPPTGATLRAPDLDGCARGSARARVRLRRHPPRSVHAHRWIASEFLHALRAAPRYDYASAPTARCRARRGRRAAEKEAASIAPHADTCGDASSDCSTHLAARKASAPHLEPLRGAALGRVTRARTRSRGTCSGRSASRAIPETQWIRAHLHLARYRRRSDAPAAGARRLYERCIGTAAAAQCPGIEPRPTSVRATEPRRLAVRDPVGGSPPAPPRRSKRANVVAPARGAALQQRARMSRPRA